MNKSFKTFSILATIALLLFACKNDKKTKATPEPEITKTIKKLSDEALLDTVQKQTFKYFWDFAEPNSGLARERYHPDGIYPHKDKHIVTTGGSGFGLMATLVAIERGFITREEGLNHFNKNIAFLETADRFHGAWSHWINGNTGKVQPFGADDNGGDLVETSFLAQGLICVREYFKNGNEQEQQLAQRIDKLWKDIEWDWYTDGQETLHWHWSPTLSFEKDFELEGYNETLITYVMAASSPTHTISKNIYDKGWARSGDIKTSNTKYGFDLILKHNYAEEYGGPLFWAHYSHVGLNPKGLTDQYADYWKLNVNHSKINYQYCVENPEKFKGYNENCWGLTASYTRSEDGTTGYTAHAPNNDKGVISPTAAVSSIPYTPEESMRAIRYFYEDLHDLTWGPAGFYDAFSVHHNNWVAKRYLAIDQGPMIVMIENYRTGLLWNLFMNAPEIKKGLKKLGITSNPK